MTKARRDGLYLVFLGSIVFVVFGVVIAAALPHPISDFRFNYNGVRCLIQNVDPYKQSEFLRVLQADGVSLGSGFLSDQAKEMAQYMYPPTCFVITPLGILPWRIAAILWAILLAGTFIFASYLMWQVAAEYAPVLSGFQVFFMLAGSAPLIAIGNACGLVISLTVIAICCFVKERFAVAGVLCFAVSLMIKPHDVGLIWLYFLLAGGTYRKRALQTLGTVVVLSIPLVLWVSYVSPHWLSELQGNLAVLNARGHLNDPGPSSMAGHGIAMVISLQAVISFFKDDPHFYNTLTYVVCGTMLILWSIKVLRSPQTKESVWYALAVLSALSLLPVYHRAGDAKLLMLAIPACAMLWTKGGVAGRIGALVTTAGILLSGELQWAIFFAIFRHVSLPASRLVSELWMAVQVFTVPLSLLAVCVFYLFIYVRGESGVPVAGAGRADRRVLELSRADSQGNG